MNLKPKKPSKYDLEGVSSSGAKKTSKPASSATPELKLKPVDGPVTEDQAKFGMQSLPPELMLASDRPGMWQNFITKGQAGNAYSQMQNELLIKKQAQEQALMDAIRQHGFAKVIQDIAGQQAMAREVTGNKARSEESEKERNFRSGEQQRNEMFRANEAMDSDIRKQRMEREKTEDERGYKRKEETRQSAETGQAGLDVGYVPEFAMNVGEDGIDPELLARVGRAMIAQTGQQGGQMGIPTALSSQALLRAQNSAAMPNVAAREANSLAIQKGEADKAGFFTAPAINRTGERVIPPFASNQDSVVQINRGTPDKPFMMSDVIKQTTMNPGGVFPSSMSQLNSQSTKIDPNAFDDSGERKPKAGPVSNPARMVNTQSSASMPSPVMDQLKGTVLSSTLGS